MKWNPFDLIEPAIDKTSELLFPIKAKFWFKLGFVNFLSSLSIFKNSNFNFNNKSDNSIINNAIQEIQKSKGIIGILVSVFLIISLIFMYIGSIFTFIFIDSILTKKCEIKNSYNKNKSKGVSFFIFSITIGTMFIIISAIIFLPLLIKLFNQGFQYFTTVDVISQIITVLPSILIFIVFLIAYIIFMTFVIDISLIDMYKNNIKITSAIKNTFNCIKKQKLEAFLYLLTRIALGIVVLLILVVLLIPFFIIFIALGLIGLILYYLMGFFMLIIAIPVILTMMYLFSVVSLPISVFNRNFSILAYENFYKELEKPLKENIIIKKKKYK